jgi:hypothetical protein
METYAAPTGKDQGRATRDAGRGRPQHAAPNRGQAFAEGEEASRHPLIDRSHAKAAKVLPSTALTVALGLHGGVASTKTCLAVACRREALPMCRDNDPR